MRVGALSHARGIVRPRGMNKLETVYDAYLESLSRAGVVLWHRFEPIKLKLGKGSYYTPDFLVMKDDGSLEVHEVKGFWREAARVRIKVASGIFPFRFIAITKEKGLWKEEVFE